VDEDRLGVDVDVLTAQVRDFLQATSRRTVKADEQTVLTGRRAIHRDDFLGRVRLGRVRRNLEPVTALHDDGTFEAVLEERKHEVHLCVDVLVLVLLREQVVPEPNHVVATVLVRVLLLRKVDECV
jgi:hypothetical protein